MKRNLLPLTLLVAVLPSLASAVWVADFEGLPYSDTTPLYENGANLDGLVFPDSRFGSAVLVKNTTFEPGPGFTFYNEFNLSWASWSGWAYSQEPDLDRTGFAGQFEAAPGPIDGAYGIAFDAAFLKHPRGVPQSIAVTNNAWAASSMETGDRFAKAFGGVDGTDPDFFEVTFTGFSQSGNILTETGSVTVALGDFRSDDPSEDFILTDWITVDLTPLGEGDFIQLSYASSDVSFGFINTPLYVAVDNLTVVPEPSQLLLTGIGLAALVCLWRRRRNCA